MKTLILFTTIAFLSTVTFAASGNTGFGKNSLQLKALGSAWTTNHSKPALDKNDLEMGYGGRDIFHNPSIAAVEVA